jgi:glyoxylase-like metal-dependent hydrolase (beta-lactamase superfamily II)
MKAISMHLGYAGYCWAKEHHAIRGGNRRSIRFHALWGLLRHPEQGYILFDVGYTRRFYQETRFFPNKIYALMTKVVVHEEDEIVHQLTKQGIQPESIKKIVVSHFHADHVGGLLDFPQAEIITTRAAYQQVMELPKWRGFTKGVLKGLHPEDLGNRIRFVEDMPVAEDAIFGRKYDLLGDGSIWAYALPGHARGQLGLLVKTEKRTYFLIADACWLRESYLENRLPHPIVRLFFDSWSDFKETLLRVQTFAKEYPEVVIVPTHCYASTSGLVNDKINFDAL